MVDVLRPHRPERVAGPARTAALSDPWHAVQFYESDALLLDTVCEFVRGGLQLGDATVVIATGEHRAALEARLIDEGLDLAGACVRGQYVALDAGETLSSFLIDGVPDPSRFSDVIGGLIARLSGAGQAVRAFGEMVALLASSGRYAEAIQLERLWNDLQEQRAFSLLCGYSMSLFGRSEQTASLAEVCAEHVRVMPAESYTALVTPDERLRAITRLQQQALALETEVVERQRAERALQSLLRISQKLHATLDLDTLLDDLVLESLQLVGAEGGCAGLRAPEGLVSRTYLRGSEPVPWTACWPAGHGLPGWLLEHKAPYVANDALSDRQSEPARCLQLGIRSALSMPILDAQGEVLGFFELHNKIGGGGFTSADCEKLVAVSQIASVAIQNAHLYREAQEAIRLRNELLSTASHELRTPLTTVSAHAQLLLRRLARHGSVDAEAVERGLRAISQQSDKLARLIEQCLDVTRLETGTLTLDLRPADLRALVERVAADAALRTSQAIVVQAPSPVVMSVDALRLDQMLTNLIDNAIKYGAADRPIEVSLIGDAAGWIELAVRDYGPGIPEEKLAGLFERFFQAHAESYKSGMGLGLYISHQIVELHGGTVRAELPADGGARFVVRLPDTRAVAPTTENARQPGR